MPTSCELGRWQAAIGLFEISAQCGNEIVSRTFLFIRCASVLSEDVKADVTFDHLRHQCIHSTPTDGDIVEYLGALPFLIQRLFDGTDLAHDSPDAVQKPLFLFYSMSHLCTPFIH